eukprot:CAMPEP_0182892394 /NCGR_PEP_ID=MMETSP0034_2-20130328/23845_1 /TAXON_ID=156128 /ORGANISM="Nephroselmis pyriformis, Strain CCMP717" /LENGTH=108 /DNA_ID=CAMNT_0025026071 /DNA_START=372 /DNA_END=699 /DNA_ORIENTATION=+
MGVDLVSRILASNFPWSPAQDITPTMLATASRDDDMRRVIAGLLASKSAMQTSRRFPARMSYPPAPNRRRLSSPPRVMPAGFTKCPSAAYTQGCVPLSSLSTAIVTDR